MEYNIIDMNALGKQAGASSSMVRFGDREMEAVSWDLSSELKALDILKDMAKNGKPFRFEGHPSKWLLTAMCRALAGNGVTMFIPMLKMETPLKPFKVGAESDGVSSFEIKEDGDTVFITYTFAEMKPDEMHKSIVPPVAAGKDIVIRATRHPILNAVCMALAYADDCRSVWVTPDFDDDYCVCAVTNTGEYKLGQQRKL